MMANDFKQQSVVSEFKFSGHSKNVEKINHQYLNSSNASR